MQRDKNEGKEGACKAQLLGDARYVKDTVNCNHSYDLLTCKTESTFSVMHIRTSAVANFYLKHKEGKVSPLLPPFPSLYPI